MFQPAHSLSYKIIPPKTEIRQSTIKYAVLLGFLFLYFIGHSKLFIFIFVIIRKKLKGFLQRILQYIWNIRCLIDEVFVPSAHRTSVLYCILSDFRTEASAGEKLTHNCLKNSSNRMLFQRKRKLFLRQLYINHDW
jgi:hypothetical protein